MASLKSHTPDRTDDSLQPVTESPVIGLTIRGRKEGKDSRQNKKEIYTTPYRDSCAINVISIRKYKAN